MFIFHRAGPAALLVTLLLSGCGLPVHGPQGEAIERAATVRVHEPDATALPYCLVSVTPDVIQTLQHHQPRFAGRFAGLRGREPLRIGVGDVVSVTLFEAAAGGLFFPLEGGNRSGNFLTLPNQIVDNNGNITVPYAGPIVARGRSVSAVQSAIVEKLKSRALEPQAVVTIVEQRSSFVSVFGEVNNAVRMPLGANAERVLDVLARAGGPRNQGLETWVLLERDNKIAVTPFEALIREPSNNIAVKRNDTIYVYKEPQTFVAFGATGRQGQFPFDAWKLSLAEALGKSGGLIDEKAEPAWVFVYRLERRDVVEHHFAKCPVGDAALVPVIYEVNLRDPSGFFAASQMPMRTKDVVYVANARTVEASKFMNYVRTVSATIQDPMQTALTGYALKAAISGTGGGTVIITSGTTP